MENQIRSIILDDEAGNIVTLTKLLNEYCPEVNIVATANNSKDGYEIIESMQPDLLFLDIEMPYGNGFDLLDKFSTITFEVIFITAFNNYALKAFKYAALDYILKPVNIAELKEAVKKASGRLNDKNINTRINVLLNNLKSGENASKKIGLPTLEGFHFVDIDRIMYLEADGSYTNIFIEGKKKELVSKNLKEFEDILPTTDFCRVHHSHIINISFVKKYFKGRGGYVEMEDGTKIEISARKKEDFFLKFRH